jgi:hypothetical protein
MGAMLSRIEGKDKSVQSHRESMRATGDSHAFAVPLARNYSSI